MLGFGAISAALCILTVASVKDDLDAGLDETSWFSAADHVEELGVFMDSWNGRQHLHCIDLFGYAGSVAKMWEKNGFKAVQYDIGLNRRSDDLLSRRGFLHLTRLGLQLVDGGLLMGGPPCAMNIFMSSSVHRRHIFGPLGDTSNKKVRMSNLLASNLYIFITLLLKRRKFWFLLEQPASSWLFKMEIFLSLALSAGCVTVSAWMGHFNHDLHKPTHLFGTVPNATALARTMTKRDRLRISARLAKRQQKRKNPKVYYVKDTKTKSVTGHKDLSSSAAYIASFARALFHVWLAAFGSLQGS